MRFPILRSTLSAALAATSLGAWSPRFHEAQTELALGLIPKRMALYMRSHAEALRKGARGISNDQVPNVEDVEASFRRIIEMSENHRSSDAIVRELGVLAHQVQLLTDPSATTGVTPLREQFEQLGDEFLPKLVAFQEPFWSLTEPLDPRPRLLQWDKQKYERHRLLLAHIDPTTGQRVGSWDVLSAPFAQLQLSYSNGVNATANIWIQLWQSAGDAWDLGTRE
ncbi:MAG TPA: hypothetical protein PKL14_05965 [Holophaga sp.]|nr:hypothetical protein [Holophaga sp.]